MNFPGVIALAVAASIATSALGAVTTTVVDVPSASVTQRFLYVRPDNPVATIVSIPGGDGVYHPDQEHHPAELRAACDGLSLKETRRYRVSIQRRPLVRRGVPLVAVD